jgi:hypothetical protein
MRGMLRVAIALFNYNDKGPTEGAYNINESSKKIFIPTAPFNMQMAGRRVPNKAECDQANAAFQRQDYYDQYGPSPQSQWSNGGPQRSPMTSSPSWHHQQSPQQHQQAPNDIFHDHPSRRDEFRSSFPTPHYNEVTYSASERQLNYMCGNDGTPALQFSDFMHQGFTNPGKSFQRVGPMHDQIMGNWETTSKYGTITRGPNTLALTGSSSFTPLESHKPTDVINWFNTLGQVLEPLLAITPGMGLTKYDKMGRALHLLLASKLLPCMLTTIIQNCGQ